MNFTLYLFFCAIPIFTIFLNKNTINGSISKRIIGGGEAYAGQFPFSAAIYIRTNDGNYFCGGALYNSQFIVTAGQCVNGALSFTIYLGTNDVNSNETTALRVATEEYILHPEFNPLTLENDVGIIRLRIPVEYTMYIQGVDRVPTAEIPGARYLKAIGWGQVSDENPKNSDYLNWVEVVSITNDECKFHYGSQIVENMICAVGSFNEGTCSGDTGSPLLDNVRGSYPVLAGISSFYSSNGCESTDPSGYTRIYPYISWIRNNTVVST